MTGVFMVAGPSSRYKSRCSNPCCMPYGQRDPRSRARSRRSCDGIPHSYTRRGSRAPGTTPRREPACAKHWLAAELQEGLGRAETAGRHNGHSTYISRTSLVCRAGMAAVAVGADGRTVGGETGRRRVCCWALRVGARRVQDGRSRKAAPTALRQRLGPAAVFRGGGLAVCGRARGRPAFMEGGLVVYCTCLDLEWIS